MDSDSDNSEIENADPTGVMVVPSVRLPVGNPPANPVVSIMPHALAPVIRQHSPARGNVVPGTDGLHDAVVPSFPFQIVNPTANPGFGNIPQSPDPRNQYSLTGQHIQGPSVLGFQANTGAYQNASGMWSQQNASNQLFINPARQPGFQEYAQLQSPFNVSGQGHEAPGPSSVPFGGTRTRAQPPDYDLPPLPETFSDPYFFAGRQPPPDPILWFPNSQENLQQLAQGQPQGPYSMNFQAPAQMAYHGQIPASGSSLYQSQEPQFQQVPFNNMRSPDNVPGYNHRMNIRPIQSRAPQVTQAIPTSTALGPIRRYDQMRAEDAAQEQLTRTQRVLADMRSREENRARSSSVAFDPYAPRNPASVRAGSSSTPLQRSTAATGSLPALPGGNQASYPSTSVDPYAASNLTLAQLESLTPLQRSNLHMSRHPSPMGNQATLVIPYAVSSSAPPQRSIAEMGFRQPPPAGNQASSSSAPFDPNAELEHIQVNRLPDEEGHQLVGKNCYICKRDLSYPPEGPIIENQQLLPAATVLPCGHAFHTVCLDKITPEALKNDPPCLPCATGDSE